MYQAVYTKKLSGNGVFTKKCQQFFEDKYGFKKCVLTTSGTDALEMAAILCDVQPGDEVIVPSYTFVSSALAFVRQGARIIFADSYADNPNIDADKLESLITDKTKVIVPVHYAGVACDMDKIMDIANRHGIFVVEDAAQAIDSYYKGRPLGSIGHFGCFSFHETKNVTAGSGRKVPTARSSSVAWSTNTDGWIRVPPSCHQKSTLHSCGHSWKTLKPSRLVAKRSGIPIKKPCNRWQTRDALRLPTFPAMPPTTVTCTTSSAGRWRSAPRLSTTCASRMSVQSSTILACT